MRTLHPLRSPLTLLPLVALAACQPPTESEPTGSTAEAAAKAALGAELRLEPSELGVIAAGQARFAYLGRTVSTFKLADRDGNWFEMTLDEEQRPVDFDELARADRETRLDWQGALDDSVVALLAAGAERLEVLLWVATPGVELAPRPEARGEPLSPEAVDAIYAETDRLREKALAPFVEPVLERVKAFDREARAETLSPAIQANLSSEALERLARDPGIDRIYASQTAEPELDMAKATIGIPALHAAGITGSGVKVALTEWDGHAEPGSLFLSPFIQDTTNVCGAVSRHATMVAAVLKERRVNVFGTLYAEDGVSPGVELRVGGSCGGNSLELHAASDRAVAWGARVINLSWGLDTGLMLGASDRFYDDIVLHRFRTIVKSAGNRANVPGCFVCDDILTSPGLAYNVITVGGLDDMNTASWSDDVMWPNSSFTNPVSTHADRQKPEVIAPAANLTLAAEGPATFVTDSGTSGAAPQVAASTALLIQKNGTLSAWPEVTRAAMMATARNIEGASRLSDHDGAGALVTSTAGALIDNPALWGTMSYTCSKPVTLDLMSLAVGPLSRNRVVISWDSDPAFADYATRPSVDLDLEIVNSAGAPVASSASWDNTYEIVEFDALNADTFTLRVRKFRCDTDTWLGWAWHSANRLRPPKPKLPF
ncbi:MAG TPA: S8 family serine peptidase [Polyangiaceae bacterium]